MKLKLLVLTVILSCSSRLVSQKLLQPEELSLYQSYFDGIDITQSYISDQYISRGINHIYFQQTVNDIPVYQSRASIHFGMGFATPYTTNRTIANLDNLITDGTGRLTPSEVLQEIALEKKFSEPRNITFFNIDGGPRLIATGFAHDAVMYKKVFYRSSKKVLTPAFLFTIDQKADGDLMQYIADANTGKILESINLTVECNFGQHTSSCANDHKRERLSPLSLGSDSSYNVFPMPVESPNFDVRAEVIKPWLQNPTASPDGWHNIDGTNYTVTRGNNVDAYLDKNDSDSPTNGDADRADGGVALDFDFPLDLSSNIPENEDAAVTNLFYWSNIIHDVMYNYGFDEQSGNFQQHNYTAVSAENDGVRAEAQDGQGVCNANFGTPPDGGAPRMQMYLCGNRDGDFDNGVIIHEYGHGISTRLTGGPAAAGCLNNREQMGEGWSDYLGVVLTMEPGDAGTDSRGMGTYLFGQGPNGNGIRPFPYSTDMSINPMTYGSRLQSNFSVPHGLGSIWATMLWDLTWNLIDIYDFDVDNYNGTGGNNKAIELVMEAMKLQPCWPGFVDGRDAILAADQAINGGIHDRLIWETFARRGLGWSAYEGSTRDELDGKEAFDMPPKYSLDIAISADKATVGVCENVTFEVLVSNGADTTIADIDVSTLLPDSLEFVSATNGGSLSGNTINWPTLDLNAGQDVSFFFTVSPSLLLQSDDITRFDDLEVNTFHWEKIDNRSGRWDETDTEIYSGNVAFFAADHGSPGLGHLAMAYDVAYTDASYFTFWHKYDTEEDWDGGLVQISVDEGLTWADLSSDIVLNPYNGIIYNSTPGYSGDSEGFIKSAIDLSSYDGQSGRLRFLMNNDEFVSGEGWYVDDITVGNVEQNIAVTAIAESPSLYRFDMIDDAVEIDAMDVDVNYGEVDCASNPTGSLSVSVAGGSGNYSYIWEENSTIPERSSLTPGVYQITISDNCQELELDLEVLPGDRSMVTTNIDIVAGSLREVLSNGCATDTILFHPSLLYKSVDVSNGVLSITQDKTLLGLGYDMLFLDADDANQVFDVSTSGKLSLHDMTILKGASSGNSHINTDGELTVKEVRLADQ